MHGTGIGWWTVECHHVKNKKNETKQSPNKVGWKSILKECWQSWGILCLFAILWHRSCKYQTPSPANCHLELRISIRDHQPRLDRDNGYASMFNVMTRRRHDMYSGGIEQGTRYQKTRVLVLIQLSTFNIDTCKQFSSYSDDWNEINDLQTETGTGRAWTQRRPRRAGPGVVMITLWDNQEESEPISRSL